MIEKVGEKCGVSVSYKKCNPREVEVLRNTDKREGEVAKGEGRWHETTQLTVCRIETSEKRQSLRISVRNSVNRRNPFSSKPG